MQEICVLQIGLNHWKCQLHRYYRYHYRSKFQYHCPLLIDNNPKSNTDCVTGDSITQGHFRQVTPYYTGATLIRQVTLLHRGHFRQVTPYYTGATLDR